MNVSFRFTSPFDCIKCMRNFKQDKPSQTNEKMTGKKWCNCVQASKYSVCLFLHIHTIHPTTTFLLSHITGQTCLPPDMSVASYCCRCCLRFFFTPNLIQIYKSATDVCLWTELWDVCLLILHFAWLLLFLYHMSIKHDLPFHTFGTWYHATAFVCGFLCKAALWNV